MRMMIDLGRERGPLYIHGMQKAAAVDVDCGSRSSQGRYRRSFRSLLVDCMVPFCCGFGFQPSSSSSSSDSTANHTLFSSSSSSSVSTSDSSSSSSSSITGTFFGYRKGRVSFCLQDHPWSSRPLLLLEFSVPTAYLAREMQYGLLRIALECHNNDGSSASSCGSLFNVPLWSMYCNGRKVGFAIRRKMTETDAAVLRLMHSVSVGAGVLPHPNHPPSSPLLAPAAAHDDLLYLRASFHRVVGSLHSQSFHLINPLGSSSQELSIFLLRSSSSS